MSTATRGELTAVNANTGEVAWRVPLGVYPELIAKGVPPTGTPNLGGPTATASGLVFIAATKDALFRAFEARTGKELWHAQLEAPAAATPMTFMGRDGKQYVVIAAGGPGDTDRGGTEEYPQKLVAFALSDHPNTITTSAAPKPPVQPVQEASSPQPAPSPSLSPAELEQAHQLTQQVCTACHELGPAITAGRTQQAWKAIVDEMISFGAQANPEQAKTITEYLSQTFPVKKANQ